MNRALPEPGQEPMRELALVARQPIFDVQLEVVAHELLYRSAPSHSTAVLLSTPTGATARVIVDACLEIGLDRLVGRVPAHINFPRELLLIDAPVPASPERVVVEVLEDVRAEPSITRALARLRERGHRIALDDFSFEASDAALLDFADSVKIDIQSMDTSRLQTTVQALRGRGLTLIAEKIETAQQFEFCKSLGFERFQGYFLRRPQTVSGPRVPSSRLATLRLLTELQSADAEVQALERLLERDPATSYRVLRCLNSSYYHFPQPISSLRQAIVILGLDELRRLCTVALLGEFDTRPLPLLVDALIRARMCERMAAAAGFEDTGPYFVTGLLSLLDGLLGVARDEALASLPLVAPIVRALLSGEGPLGKALSCVECYERGDWAGVGFGALSTERVRDIYLEAVRWADVSGGWLQSERRAPRLHRRSQG